MTLPDGLELRPFDPQMASEAEFVALNAIQNEISAEQRPEYPPATVEETIAGKTAQPSIVHTKEWNIWDGPKIVATAGVVTYGATNNQHLAEMWIAVLPDRRREGIGSHLLGFVAQAAELENRSLLTTWTSSTSPVGERFLERLGAEAALPMRHNQLLLTDLNRPFIEEWLRRARDLEGEFFVGLWEGPYPPEEIEAIAKMHGVMNTAPRGNLQMEDWAYSVEEIREWEASEAAQRRERWTMYARHRPSGELAGYTEVYWHPAHPDVIGQGDTAVVPTYRNRGLARWLKAAMVEKVLNERPAVQRIRTGNADINAAMLKINEEMGFKVFRTSCNWQVSLEKVQAYLRERGLP
jgi:GNAT superfamily N-acetyltransferase